MTGKIPVFDFMDIQDITTAIRDGRIRITDHAEAAMKPFEKCPICSGTMTEKVVDKIIRGGNNTAIITVRAEVCRHCGEKLYAPETVREFDRIRDKLERQETGAFHPLGQTFQVA